MSFDSFDPVTLGRIADLEAQQTRLETMSFDGYALGGAEMPDEAYIEKLVGKMVKKTLPALVAKAVREELARAGLRPGTYIRVLSPDGTREYVCVGGLRVEKKAEGDFMLLVRVDDRSDTPSCWKAIARYRTEEAAVAALRRVSDAIGAGRESIKL